MKKAVSEKPTEYVVLQGDQKLEPWTISLHIGRLVCT